MTDRFADRLREALRVCLVADTGLAPAERLPEAVAAALRGGVTAVQLRAKAATTVELLELAQSLGAVCRGANVPLIVNNRIDVALAADADGVHVGHVGEGVDSEATAEARHVLGPEAIVGVSVDSAQDARLATAQGASYVSAGPMFPPSDRDTPGTWGGEALLRSVRAATRLPVVVIGGITASRAATLYAAGADGVMVGSAILRAADIEAAARAFVAAGAAA